MATQVLHISIDRFGRLVLPKEIRDHLGLRAGTEFEVEEQEDAILLRPVGRSAKLTDKGGLPVFELGEPLDPTLVEETLQRVRQRRW